MERLIAQISARETDLMAAATRELGAPRSMRNHVLAGIESLRHTIAALKNYDFEVASPGNHLVRREPIGVCGLITAWNWPVQSLCTKFASALAAGCTVVAKPSEYTPFSALRLAEAIHDAGLPAGVFNLVIGDGPTVGQAISSHPGIDMVSITGSTRSGVLVAQAAAPTVKRVTQELGGKSAHIVLPDADLAVAARFNVLRGFSNSGQSCHAPTRMLVQRDQAETVLAHMISEVRKIRQGDPDDPSTTMGPVVNKAQFEKIQSYIRAGIEQGARLICGGPGRPPQFASGYYVQPTIFADVRPSMKIAAEEIFGPVLAVIAYDTVADAVAMANDSPYGLGAYVSGTDSARALAVGRQLRAGRVFLNGATASASAPMGGYKQSGNGREMGIYGLEEYLEIKAIVGASPVAA
jgi:aldehyde dehydrogenase (NAD+)